MKGYEIKLCCILFLIFLFSEGCAHNYKYWEPNVDRQVNDTFDASFFYIENNMINYREKDIFSKDMLWGETPYFYFNRLKINAISDFYDDANYDSKLEAKDKIKTIKNVASLNAKKLEFLYSEEYNKIIEGKGAENFYSKYIGLALSGGGIRSASFASGVLQGLHEIGILDKIGYMSTVSGGGYAAAWFMLQEKTPEEIFARGSEHLQHLNQFGNYLASSHYSDIDKELSLKIACHLTCLPFHWICNGLFDFDVNVRGIRNNYLAGLRRGFMYKRPFTEFQNNLYGMKWMKEYLPDKDKPFWIINMHVALNDDEHHHKNRSGDCFELTPLWAGSDATGYVKTDENHWWMTPLYGIAISGAAMDSQSLKQGPLTSNAIRAINADLGYFVPGFKKEFNDGSIKYNSFYYLTSFFPIYNSSLLTPIGRKIGIKNFHMGELWHDRTQWAKKYHLTDGGHFENLGAYSLVRRGCRLIIISDASHDPNISHWGSETNSSRSAVFSDLRELEMKLEADFGAKLEMKWETFMVENPNNDQKENFGEIMEEMVFIGEIKNLPILANNNGYDNVTIIYIKANYKNKNKLLKYYTFIDAEKKDNPSWPQDPTAKQFYSERRVLAYRTLAREMIIKNKEVFIDKVNKIKEQFSK